MKSGTYWRKWQAKRVEDCFVTEENQENPARMMRDFLSP